MLVELKAMLLASFIKEVTKEHVRFSFQVEKKRSLSAIASSLEEETLQNAMPPIYYFSFLTLRK